MSFFHRWLPGGSYPPPPPLTNQIYPNQPQQMYPHSNVNLGYPQQQQPYPPHQFSTPPPMIQSRNMMPYMSTPTLQDPSLYPTSPTPFNSNNNIDPNGGIVMHIDPKYRNMPPPSYQLSNCQGRKRALLIGINYFGTPTELRGCINDVHHVKHFLMTFYNFREQDMVILTDDQINPKNIPTKQNIIQAMQWLVHDSRPNDSYFFHFSGHGGRMKDYDNDEDDGYDETIYPVDHAIYGQIVDDMMNDIMVKPLVPGCRLTAIFDSCHSGTALDLPYVYSTQGSLKEYNFLKDAGNNLKSAGLAYFSGDPSRAISSLSSFGSRVFNGGGSTKRFMRNRHIKGSPADVIMFSGCKDDQTSADTTEIGRATGAMSFALITSLTNNRHQSYLQLLNSVRQILRQNYRQRPQLSSSHPMNMNLLFIL